MRRGLKIIDIPLDKGLNTEGQNRNLQDGEFSVLNNLEPRFGGLVKRNGSSAVGATFTGTALGLVGFSLTKSGDTTFVMRVNSDSLEFLDGSAWTTLSGGMSTSGVQYFTATYPVDRAFWLFITNGVDRLYRWDGDVTPSSLVTVGVNTTDGTGASMILGDGGNPWSTDYMNALTNITSSGLNTGTYDSQDGYITLARLTPTTSKTWDSLGVGWEAFTTYDATASAGSIEYVDSCAVLTSTRYTATLSYPITTFKTGALGVYWSSLGVALVGQDFVDLTDGYETLTVFKFHSDGAEVTALDTTATPWYGFNISMDADNDDKRALLAITKSSTTGNFQLKLWSGGDGVCQAVLDTGIEFNTNFHEIAIRQLIATPRKIEILFDGKVITSTENAMGTCGTRHLSYSLLNCTASSTAQVSIYASYYKNTPASYVNLSGEAESAQTVDIFDAGEGFLWQRITKDSTEENSTAIQLDYKTAESLRLLAGETYATATSGTDLPSADQERYLQVKATLSSAGTTSRYTPILRKLTFSKYFNTKSVPYKAKTIINYGNRLLVGGISEEESPSISRGGRLRWCAINNSDVWYDDDYEDLPERGGDIQKLDVLNGMCYAFFPSAVHRIMWTQSEDLPFTFTYDILSFGTNTPKTVQNCGNYLMFLGSDNILRAFNGSVAVEVAPQIRDLIAEYQPDCAAYDSGRNMYILNATAASHNKKLICVCLSNDEQGVKTVRAYTESYPEQIVGLVYTDNKLYASIKGTSVNRVVLLNDSTQTTDYGSATITYSATTKLYPVEIREAIFESAKVYGSSAAESVKVTLKTAPFDATGTSNNIVLSSSGTFSDHDMPADSYSLSFESVGTATASVSIQNAEAFLKSSKNTWTREG